MGQYGTSLQQEQSLPMFELRQSLLVQVSAVGGLPHGSQTIQSGIQPLRYLSMMKRQKARKNPIKLWGKLDIEDAKKTITNMMAYQANAVRLPSAEGHAEMIVGDRSEKAEKLLEIITNVV